MEDKFKTSCSIYLPIVKSCSACGQEHKTVIAEPLDKEYSDCPGYTHSFVCPVTDIEVIVREDTREYRAKNGR